MGRSTASRRVSEFVGVALFAAALIWIIALASYDPNDPVWFFSTGAAGATVNNFAGRVGAFLGELSFQPGHLKRWPSGTREGERRASARPSPR